MTEFGDKIDSLARLRRGWETMARAAAQAADGGDSRLREVAMSGANPGELRMLRFVPEELPRAAPLVVALHGCTQTAAGYENGAGWSELAERLGFALLCPEQRRANNGQLCFNWFQPGDIRRGQGEVDSIRQMIEQMLSEHQLDRGRVFITGLSAGGAMTSAMLASYPELFAGGAIIAGLPYGGATTVQEALDEMMTGRVRPAEQWGALVRGAAPPPGRWPVISVWHGSADATVSPLNAEETLKQWRDVQGLAEQPSVEDVMDGARHRVWLDRRGRPVLEAFLVPGLGHGTPIAPTLADPARRCGVAGPFILDAGIPSTRHIASFWGLLRAEHAKAAAAVPPAGAQVDPPAPQRHGLEEILGGHLRPGELLQAARALDPGPTIARALRAAGLMKGAKP